MEEIKRSTKAGFSLCVVGCVHGNERIGERVYNEIISYGDQLPGVTAVLANKPAMDLNKRYVDQDLNRSFPGDIAGNEEERLAAQLLKKLDGFDFVLDLHSTSSELKKTSLIVPSIEGAYKKIIATTIYTEIIEMESGLTGKSLMGNIENAVSIELNEKYAETQEAVDEIINIIKVLIGVTPRKDPISRSVYKVAGIIGKDVVIPINAENFKEIEGLDITPFLLHEREYKDHQGFNVSKVSDIVV